MPQPSKAATVSRVGPNLRLGDDPMLLPLDRRAQAEPHLVRSATDPQLLVATFQEGRFQNGGALGCGYAISRDGGLSWTRALIPSLTQPIDQGPFDRASDPVAAIDLRENVFLNTLGILGTPPAALLTSVVLSRSSDAGLTFTAPVHIAAATNTANFLDKNWLSANTFAHTPTANRLAAAFTFTTGLRAATGFNEQPIALTYSDDAGQTWSPLQMISSPVCIGALPVFLPDGALAVVYWSFVNELGTAFENRIDLAYSPDGGVTFEKPRLVARVNPHDDATARDGFNLPAMTTDRQVGVLYVAYQARHLFTPRVLFTKSLDRGRTWSQPQAVNDTPAGRSVFNAAIAVSPDGQHVSIIFYDKRHDDGSGHFVDLYLAESFDGGDTWEPNLRLSEISSDLRLAPLTDRGYMLGDYQAVAEDVDFATPAVACWIDTRSGSPDPFVTQVTRARGASFDAWRSLRFDETELKTSATAATGDLDADGIPNLAEYALALDPRRADLPPVRVTPAFTEEGGRVVLSYERLRTLGDLAFAWQSSTNLVDWSPAFPASEQVTKLSEPLRERVQAVFPQTPRALRFYRLTLRQFNLIPP